MVMLCVPGQSPTSEYSSRHSSDTIQYSIRRARSTPNLDGAVAAGPPFAWYSYTTDARPRNVPQLPIELIDRIIDFLHDERIALHACSLVCTTWRDAALHHMFWTMRLLSSSRFRKFIHVACFRPRIGQYVRSMLLGFHRIPDGFQSLIPSIPHNLLPNLRSLALQHTGHTPVFAELLQHSIFASVSSLSLTHVWFSSFSNFRALICSFRHLRDLSMGNVTWERDDPPSPVSAAEAQPVFHLRNLELYFNGNFLPHIVRWMLGTQILDKVRNLLLYLESTSVAEPFNQVLGAVGQTLEHLKLQMGAIFYSTPQAVEIIRGLTLAPCVRLSSLHLAPSESGRPPNSAWMVDALRTLPTSCTRHALRHISLQFSLWDAAHWGFVIDFQLLEVELGTPEAPADAYPYTASRSSQESRVPDNFGVLTSAWNAAEKYATMRRGGDKPSASRTLTTRSKAAIQSRYRPLPNLRYSALRALSVHVRAEPKFNVRDFVLTAFPALRRRADVVVQQVW
ncbi:hypothetical protein BKA62DRAFT_346646 [Auriculariales sp. MPI-PUGE-AT-0066]|nr:hypothetical protein BKA62DRAFT_346646 [Auriculariales sp. MPI-PUGE-AT-0066]